MVRRTLGTSVFINKIAFDAISQFDFIAKRDVTESYSKEFEFIAEVEFDKT